MKIVVTVLFIYLIVYFSLIFKAKSNLIKTREMIDIFNSQLEKIDFSNTYGNHFRSMLKLDEAENVRIINKLVLEMPRVKEIPKLWWVYNPLSLDKSNYENYINANYLLRNMVEIESQIRFDYRKSFNPLNTFIFILSAPSKILSFLGLTIQGGAAKIWINLFTWVIGFLLRMFSDEIKSFIIELIQKIGLI